MASKRYHHGDLRAALIDGARGMLRERGIERLSIRKLAGELGVTPAAIYHHFDDKNALLCAIAEEGFEDLEAAVSVALDRERDAKDLETRFRHFARAYVEFAAARPETYDLMFGRTLWRAGAPTESLRRVAYATFKGYADRARELHGTAPGPHTLRVAQASWATLHGLCRLRIDGIYDPGDGIEAILEEAVRMISGRFEASR